MLVAILVCETALFAGVSRPEKVPTDKSTPAHLTENLPENNLIKETLKNGLTVLIKVDISHPITAIHATIRAGLSTEGEYAGSGISHFIEHMLFKGTEKRGPSSIEDEVKSYGGIINASTGMDATDIHITLPSDYTEKALELMEDITFHPLFDASEIEKERQVILQEIRLGADDPAKHIMQTLWTASYLEHPYKLPIIGYADLFKDLRREDLLKYHASHYAPNNAILTVVGDVSAETVLSQIKDIFGKNKMRKYPPALVPIEQPQNSTREATDYAEINLGYLAMGYHTTEFSNPDLYALDVFSIILGGWDGSRLNKTLVKEKRLVYTINSFNYTPRYPGLFIIYAMGDSGNLKKAKDDILGEIEKISSYGVTAEELSAAKNMVMADYINSLETAGGLARAISEGEFFAQDPTFFKKYVESIKKVDNDMIKETSRAYLHHNNLTVSYLYPSYLSRKPEGQEEPVYAKNAAYEKGYIPKGKVPRFKKVVLPNGIRLIMKEDRRIPKVSVVCAFLGGVRAETQENNGISNLTAAILLKGTKNRKESEIKSFAESMGGHISHFSGRNAFGVSAEFLSENTAVMLDLVGDVLQNPEFPESEIEKEKEKLYAAIKAEDDDIYSVGFLRLRKNIFGNHPYGMRTIGETDSLKKIKRADLQNFHKKFCVAKNAVISMAGDFDPSEMARLMEKNLSRLGGANVPELKEAETPHVTGVVRLDYEMEKEQSMLLFGFTGASLSSNDRYPLEILSSILSGENGRLYKNIRNNLGLSYTQGTFSAPGIDNGYIASFVATDITKLKEAEGILLKELTNVSGGDISGEEIELAKSSLIGRHKIFLQTLSSITNQTAFDELYGIGYDAYLNYPDNINRVTREDLLRVAKKYIDLKNFVDIKIRGKSDE
ncbi:MAG: insulinase family protein [Candidatus Omnitrophica bacterium]|nr:insulinase family protein [Candidatus Omnitrophota bacterium]